jgi:nucleoid-associated protein YgaU
MAASEYVPATIKLLDRDMNETDTVDVLFNPTEYSLDKSVEYGSISLPGMDTPVSQFVSGNAEMLSMELLVDTYETGEDVREHVDKLDQLVRVDGERHAPPLCKFIWDSLRFTSVVESLKKTYTLFMPDGRPVRANLNITFKRYETVSRQLKKENRNSPDRTKRRLIKEEQSLWALAATEYGDPGRWRIIAEANKIRNPRTIEPGRELLVPPLQQ